MRKVRVGHLNRPGDGRRKTLVELQNDLVSIIREPHLMFNQPAAIANILADPAVLGVVKIVDDFVGVAAAVGRPVAVLDGLLQPAPARPNERGDHAGGLRCRVAGGRVNVLEFAVALGVILIMVFAVKEQLVAGTDGIVRALRVRAGRVAVGFPLVIRRAGLLAACVSWPSASYE